MICARLLSIRQEIKKGQTHVVTPMIPNQFQLLEAASPIAWTPLTPS